MILFSKVKILFTPTQLKLNHCSFRPLSSHANQYQHDFNWEGQKCIFHFENNIRKVSHNYKLTSSIGFIIFAPGHKVKYYLCTAKQSFISFAQTERVNYQISAFALIFIYFFLIFSLQSLNMQWYHSLFLSSLIFMIFQSARMLTATFHFISISP